MSRRRFYHQCWPDAVAEAFAAGGTVVALCGRSIKPLSAEEAKSLAACPLCEDRAADHLARAKASKWVTTITASSGAKVTWVGGWNISNGGAA